jgi:DtxR family Mn-dependent transcriptional regulator
MSSRDVDEVLEALWYAEEAQGRTTAEALVSPLQAPILQQAVQEAEALKLISREGSSLIFTESGRRRARDLVRRHRLAERLFHDVLDLAEAESEPVACRFEHILSADAANSICTLLGHPATCPHGKAIPPGDCCDRGLDDARPLVLPLSRLKTGESGRVAYVGTRHRGRHGRWGRFERLSSLGILPGMPVTLEQRHPSYVVRVDEMTLGLDGALADEIYVRRDTET